MLEAPAPPGAAERYGPNTAEVTAFIESVGRLSPSKWKKVIAARESAARVTRDGSGQPAEIVRALLGGVPDGAGTLPEPMSNVATDLAGILASRSDVEAVAAWQAASALVRRRQLSALTFAAHYAAFASVIPPVQAQDLPPIVERFANALRWLDAAQWGSLARPWTLDREASGALLQAALKSRAREAEEAVALAAMAVAPKHVAGDPGWAAVKTAVHGGRVLSAAGELTAEQLRILWTPLEDAIALRSLTEAPTSEKPARPRARKGKAPAPPAAAPETKVEKKRPTRQRSAPAYGPNTAEVAAFVKAVPELTAIQWLRVLDRRQLVASVTREGEDESAVVVRSILAAVKGSAGLERDARCAVFAAVERAAFAMAAWARLDAEQFGQHYGSLAEVLPVADADTRSFAARVAALNPEEWSRLAAVAPPADVAAVEPLVNAGSALAAPLDARSDSEVVVAWHAVTALVRRHRLSPIKFAVAYAPFASAVVVTRARGIAPVVQRYLTAVGRLSAHQCAVLAEPWLLPDDVSNALAKATAGVETRAAEEAAALAALVTVPMRVTGDAGWAACKTATFGGRVIAARSKLTDEELLALWKPLERAVPIASLVAPSKSR
ncbi:MAG TPA: hypothetical protein VFL29_03345 [Candidatus Dormibacteraeota bacterium]|nr:hypothetical protein [Candidatus Dormibacteraeota bacterium]